MKRLLSSRSSASFIFPCVKFVPVASLSRFFPTGRHRCRGSSILEGIAVEVLPYWKCNQTVLSYFRCHSCVTFPFGLVCVLASFLCAVASSSFSAAPHYRHCRQQKQHHPAAHAWSTTSTDTYRQCMHHSRTAATVRLARSLVKTCLEGRGAPGCIGCPVKIDSILNDVIRMYEDNGC
jgi:hypothetical protein